MGGQGFPAMVTASPLSLAGPGLMRASRLTPPAARPLGGARWCGFGSEAVMDIGLLPRREGAAEWSAQWGPALLGAVLRGGLPGAFGRP
jgi:hypothetical protein